MNKIFTFTNKSGDFETSPIQTFPPQFAVQMEFDCSGTFAIDVFYSNHFGLWSKDNDMSLTGVSDSNSPIFFDFETSAARIKFVFRALTGTITEINGYM